MPKFEVITKEEAQQKSKFGGERGRILAMYTFFIEQLKDGKAGKLQPSEGETIQAVRRRLGKAAKLLGKELTIKKVNNEVFFWVATPAKSKRGRKKASQKSSESADVIDIQTARENQEIKEISPRENEIELTPNTFGTNAQNRSDYLP